MNINVLEFVQTMPNFVRTELPKDLISDNEIHLCCCRFLSMMSNMVSWYDVAGKEDKYYLFKDGVLYFCFSHLLEKEPSVDWWKSPYRGLSYQYHELFRKEFEIK